MYKSRLQELCQKRQWSLPEYSTTKVGVDHDPRFTATITVNGLPFQTQSPCKSSKIAQNEVAKLAFTHFTLPQPSLPIPPLLFSPPPPPTSHPTSLMQPPPFPQPSFPQPSFPQPSFPQSSLPQSSASPLSSSASSGSIASSGTIASSASSGSSTDVGNVLETASQLEIQQTCLTSQANDTATNVKSDIVFEDKHLYKIQLQNYAQKRNVCLPVYSSERVGPHASHFKCKVTINGQSYESPESFPKLKDAEHAAARVALMSLLPDEDLKDDAGVYKNLLQEYAQKEGCRLPIYTTNREGEAHLLVFVSNVEIDGKVFTGREARTRKQAEMNAAKVAYTSLKNCRGMSIQNPLAQFLAYQGPPIEFSSPSLQPNVKLGQQLHDHPNTPKCNVDMFIKDEAEGTKGDRVLTSSGILDCGVDNTSLSSDQLSQPSTCDCTNLVKESSYMPSTEKTTRSNKVTVYHRKTNVKVPEGCVVLPISDDNWVAYSDSK